MGEAGDSIDRYRVVALSGGVGGAKLALGLYRVLPADSLMLLANTGDDFVHLGLHVSPDLDTLMYTLAGLSNPALGWGRAEETWSFMKALRALGGEDWFQLGDADLATNVERTRRLARGELLSTVMDDFRRRLGVRAALVPMSDDPVRTVVETPDGDLDFQHYFVRDRCRPRTTGLRFSGADTAASVPALSRALSSRALEAIIVCPSNPFISIDPILAVPGVRAALSAASAPVVAVSPIIGGAAVKGPTAKMMGELGLTVSALAVAEHYGDLLDGFVLDAEDADLAPSLGVATLFTKTRMESLDAREALAREALAFAATLG